MPIFKKIMGQPRTGLQTGYITALRRHRTGPAAVRRRQAPPGIPAGPAPVRTLKIFTEAEDGGSFVLNDLVDRMFFTVIPRTCVKCRDFKWSVGWNRRNLSQLNCFTRKYVNKMHFDCDLLDHHRVVFFFFPLFRSF